MWCVKLITPAEVHVYPAAEEREHILKDCLCNCIPEAQSGNGWRMIVHKKIGNKARPRVHWVQAPWNPVHWIKR